VISDDIRSGIMANVQGLRIIEIETVRWLKSCLLSPRQSSASALSKHCTCRQPVNPLG